MSDEVDLASKEVDRIVAMALAVRMDEGRLDTIGKCHYCEESLTEGELFCDDDCRKDHEWLNKNR